MIGCRSIDTEKFIAARGPLKKRREVFGAGLERESLRSDPNEQFRLWFDEAVTAGVPKANIMVLATSTTRGVPSARCVLMKGFDERGFVFVTSSSSRKGRELEENPAACGVFYWPELIRQVVIKGRAEKLSRGESLFYFRSRPKSAQLAEYVSRQSRVVRSRRELEDRWRKAKAEIGRGEVPLKNDARAYRLVPSEFDFFQGRRSLVNDLFRYSRQGQTWRLDRLEP